MPKSSARCDNKGALPAVTLREARPLSGIALDRILQTLEPHRRIARRRCGRMTMESDFRWGLRLNGARAAAPVLFGTTGPSGVSAFATAKVACDRRFSRKANPLHTGLQDA